VTAPRTPGSSELVRLVAGREISTRIRDKTFLISSAVILVVVLGAMVFQAVVASGANNVTVGVVGDASTLEPALLAQGKAVGADVTVRTLADEAAAHRALAAGDVDGALIDGSGSAPRLLVERSPDSTLTATVKGAPSAGSWRRRGSTGSTCRTWRSPPSTRAAIPPVNAPASPSSASSCSTPCSS
jgi:ABC-2 type transport system permease protein